MAPAAIDETPDASLDPVVKPPDDVVVPPKEIRKALESVAGFVIRNGPAFEDRVRTQKRNDPRTSFLDPRDAYHSYYQWRLSEIKAGRGTDVSAGREGGGAKSANVAQQPKGPEKPADFHFSARMPNINAKDLDVLKLTARLVAKRGRSFITVLSQKESGNFQFDFLRSSHSLYQYFTHLVDQYSELLDNKKQEARFKDILQNVSDRARVISRGQRRAEWTKHQEKQKVEKEEAAEAERIAYAEIDWHDFVILNHEPITFTEADMDAEFPPPMNLNDLQSASLETRYGLSMANADRRLEEAVPDFDAPPAGSYGLQSPSQPPPPPTNGVSPAVPATPFAPPSSMSPGAQPPFSPPSQQGAHSGMRIRTDHVPRAAALRGQHAGTLICPNCNKHIPSSEMAEHLRIEMLDPQWRDQRDRANAKFSTTNFRDVDVADNLKRLANKRTDVFDSNDAARKAQKIAPGDIAQTNQTQPAQGPNPYYPNVMPGPYPAQPNMQGMSLQEQIALIHQKHQQTQGGSGGSGGHAPGT